MFTCLFAYWPASLLFFHGYKFWQWPSIGNCLTAVVSHHLPLLDFQMLICCFGGFLSLSVIFALGQGHRISGFAESLVS